MLVMRDSKLSTTKEMQEIIFQICFENGKMRRMINQGEENQNKFNKLYCDSFKDELTKLVPIFQ